MIKFSLRVSKQVNALNPSPSESLIDETAVEGSGDGTYERES
jgi:hypothetical protein